MKTIKLLAAMAVPAMFAACTNEEILVESPQKMQEVVGAELVGSDISLVASKNFGIQSRYAGGNLGFEKEDKLGLAWIPVNDNPKEAQDSTQILTSFVYANNMFEKAEGENLFTTKGNIYKGFHFAYAPYSYEEKVAEKTFIVNQKQTLGFTDETENNSSTWSKILGTQLQMSALHYLTNKNLDENNQLTESFKMESPLSQLVVKTTTEGVFATNQNLKNYDIKSIKFIVEKKVFASEAKIDATKLHVWCEDCNNDSLLVESFKTAIVTTAERTRDITTEIKEGLYKVSDKNPRLITYVLPRTTKTNMDATKNVVEIEAGGGKFVIDYETDAEEGSVADKNNKELEKLAAAYDTNGVFVGQYNKQLTLNLVLTEADFVADFTGVHTGNWAEKVQLANDLNRGKEKFVLAKDSVVNFEGANLDEDGNILVPNAGVVVETFDNDYKNGGLRISAQNTTTEWNDKIEINKIRLYVAENAALSVKSVLEPKVIVNYGTIYAGPVSTVGCEQGLQNRGRVELEYGAYVNTQTGYDGIIAYNVPKNYNINDIKVLVATTGNDHGHARVNTLMVGEGVEVDFTKSTTIGGTQGSSDRYNTELGSGPSTSTEDFGDLTGISLEISNGGIVKSTTTPKTVKNVSIKNGGELNNVNVNGESFTIEGTAAATVTCASINATAVSVENATITAETIAGAVDAENTTISAKTITGAVVAENATITAEAINGIVVLEGTNTINAATISSDVTVNAGTTSLNNVAINGTLTNKGTVNLTSENTIKIGTLTNNGTLKSNNDINVTNVNLNPNSWTTLDSDPEVLGFDKVIYYTGTYYNDNMTLQGRVTQYGASILQAAIANAADGATVVVSTDVTLTEPLSITKNVTIDLNGKTITSSLNGGKYTLDVQSGIKLTVLNGNITTTVHDNTPILVRAGGEAIVNCNIESASNGIRLFGGKLTINGGTYKSTNATGSAVRVDNNSSQLYINGGTFEGTWAGLYIANNDGTTEIKNATFKGNHSVFGGGSQPAGQDWYGGDIVFDKVTNITISGCTLSTKYIHSETSSASVINGQSISTIDNVYNTLF